MEVRAISKTRAWLLLIPLAFLAAGILAGPVFAGDDEMCKNNLSCGVHTASACGPTALCYNAFGWTCSAVPTATCSEYWGGSTHCDVGGTCSPGPPCHATFG